MKFTYAGSPYSIRFFHGTTRGLYPMPTTRYTLCRIFQGSKETGNQVHCQGQADCHPNDMYCYETGRKLSLARALEGQPKLFRTVVWEAYLGRKDNQFVSACE